MTRPSDANPEKEKEPDKKALEQALASLPQTDSLKTTLYDLADGSLKRRAAITKEEHSQNAVYHELNRIMDLNGYPQANLGGKEKIADSNLPRKWNDVKSAQEFVLYKDGEPLPGAGSGKHSSSAKAGKDEAGRAHVGKEEDSDKGKAEAAKESDAARGKSAVDKEHSGPDELKSKLKKEILDETSTAPVKRGQGYYQVLEGMNPSQAAEERVKEARRLKEINDRREVLKEGERLPTVSEEERARMLEERLKKAQAQPEAKPGDSSPSPNPAPIVKPPEDSSKPVKPGDSNPSPNPNPAPDVKPPDDSSKPVKPAENNPPAPVIPAPVPTPATPPAPKVMSPDEEKQAMQTAATRLMVEHATSKRLYQDSLGQQGIIGRTFDSAKNSIGSSGEAKPWYSPSRVWSGLFDKDLGSQAVNKRMEDERLKLLELKRLGETGATEKFKSLYKDVSGKDFDAVQVAGATPGQIKGDLPSSVAGRAFNNSQETGVGTITDVVAGVGSVAALRYGKGAAAYEALMKASGAGFLIGGTTKSALMQVDGKYANFPRDFAVGGLLGATVPVGELAGARLSTNVADRLGLTISGDFLNAHIETQGANFTTKLLSSSLKSGTSGSVFGALESPGRLAIDKLDRHEEIKATELLQSSLKGAALGFLGGSVLGVASDSIHSGFRRWRPGEVKTTTQLGVQAPEGGLGLTEAAAHLNVKAEDLLKKAAADPYGAVQDAVTLYEKTGLNIKTNNLQTGEMPLPEVFDKALKLAQNVDNLTSETAVKLSQKVEIARSVDDYLKADKSAVDKSFSEVTATNDYKEVIRLKQEQEGQQAADHFANQFRNKFEEAVETKSVVERIEDTALQNKEAVELGAQKTGEAFKQKASDYFKDMTDPAQRARLNELVDDIDAKFNPELISRDDLTGVLAPYSGKDKDLAVALLQESVGTASDTQLRARLQSLKGELQATVGDATPDVLTLDAGSSGNMLGYLYRKSISMSMSIRNLDTLSGSGAYIPNKVVLFDDLSSQQLTAAQLETLRKVPNVYVVDVGAFEKSVNVLDLAQGKQAVSEKLASLMAEARTVAASNPALLPTGVAREVLSASVDRAASAIGPNVKVIRPGSNLSIPHAKSADELARMGEVEGLHDQFNLPRTSKDGIASFLSHYVGEERELAARMLAEGAVHNSFPEMVKKATQLRQELESGLTSQGLSLNDLVLVTDKDPGGSTHLISYLFGRVNGLGPRNYVSVNQLNELVASGGARNKALAYFDDTVYSGAQTTSMLNSNISSLMPFKRIVVASLGSYEKGINSIKSTHLHGIGKVDVASAATHQPFYSNKHPFFARMSGDSQYKIKKIGGSEGFGSVQGSIIWSYMYPDNNLTFFGSQFAGGVLRLPGP